MTHCWVLGCTSQTSGPPEIRRGIRFHRLPSNPKLQKHWVVACRSEHKKISKNVRVCSKHFVEDDFIAGFNGILKLKSDSIPSVFEFSSQPAKAPSARPGNGFLVEPVVFLKQFLQKLELERQQIENLLKL